MGKQKQQSQNERTAIVILTIISYLCLLATPFLLFWRLPQYSGDALKQTFTEQVTVKNLYSYKGRGLYIETDDGRTFSLGGQNYEIEKETGYDFLELEPTISGKIVELEYLQKSMFIVKLRILNTEYNLTEVAMDACAEQRFGIYPACLLALTLAIGTSFCCYQDFSRPSKKKKKKSK